MKRQPSSCRPFLCAVLIAGLWLFSGTRVQAADTMRSAMRDLAKLVKQLMDARNETAIAVGEFSGPPNFPCASGPSMVESLIEALTEMGITEKQPCKLGLKGEYLITEVRSENDVTAKFLAVKINVIFVTALGQVISDINFARTIAEEDVVLKMSAIPVDLSPRATPRERDQQIRKALTDPQMSLRGTEIYASAAGKLGIEILMDGAAKTPENKNGLAFLKIPRGKSYAVRLINNADHEVAVQLLIDGLSMYAFSEIRRKEGPRKGEPLYEFVIIAPHQSAIIKGWHQNDEKSKEFLVTGLAESAAAKLKHHQNVGTINAIFSSCWPTNGNRPADEPEQTKGDGDATGFGNEVKAKFTQVERTFGIVRSAVSVRYTESK